MAKRANLRSSLPLVALAGASLLAGQGLGRDRSVEARSPAAAATGNGAVGLAVPGATSSGVSLAAAGQQVVVTWAAIHRIVNRHLRGGEPRRGRLVQRSAEGERRPWRCPLQRGASPPGRHWGTRHRGRLALQGRRGLARACGDLHGRWSSFSPAATVHAEGLPGARGWQSLSVDRDGARHVAWLDGRGARAEGPAPGAEGHAKHAAMRQDLFQAVWRADGTHDEVAVATDVCFCCKTAVANAPDGATYVAWRHIYPTNLRDIAVARSVDGGRTFAAPVRVSEDGWQIAGCPDDGPSAAVDAAGVLHIVWPTLIQGDAPAKAIFYSFSRDGGRTFAPRIRVDEARGGAAHPQIAVGGNRVAVVWEQGGTERGVYLREIGGDAAARSKPGLTAISLLSADRSAIYPAVAVTPRSIVAAWTEKIAGTSEIRVRTRQNSFDTPVRTPIRGASCASFTWR